MPGPASPHAPHAPHAPTIRELLSGGARSFSFEFSPPRTDAAEDSLRQAVRELEALRPTFVSVTYGAGGSTREATVRVTRWIAENTTLTPVGHLTAVNHSVAQLRHVIGAYADAGVRNLLALRGDPPGDPRGEWRPHPDGLSYAAELVRLVRSTGDFCVGVAAFPEKHPRSPDHLSDVRYLVRKCAAGADFAITQFFFRAEDYFRLRDAVLAEGCRVPIIPGILPITSVAQLQRMAQLADAAVPLDVLARLEAVRDEPEAVRRVGVDVATALCERLLAGEAPGLHFYTLNRSTATREVYQRLGLGARTPAPA